MLYGYGFNADPAKWTSTWNQFSQPITGPGVDLCKVIFKSWATETTLTDLYNAMNGLAYQQALQGNISLPIKPTEASQPVEPVPPQQWNGGPLTPPTMVNSPPAPPTSPTPH